MKIQIYTIYDTQARRAIQPIGRDNDDVAKRDFVTMCADPKTPFGAHPQDYALFHCGEWDDQTMAFQPDIAPSRIMTGDDALRTAMQQANANAIGDILRQAQTADESNGVIKPQAE